MIFAAWQVLWLCISFMPTTELVSPKFVKHSGFIKFTNTVTSNAAHGYFDFLMLEVSKRLYMIYSLPQCDFLMVVAIDIHHVAKLLWNKITCKLERWKCPNDYDLEPAPM